MNFLHKFLTPKSHQWLFGILVVAVYAIFVNALHYFGTKNWIILLLLAVIINQFLYRQSFVKAWQDSKFFIKFTLIFSLLYFSFIFKGGNMGFELFFTKLFIIILMLWFFISLQLQTKKLEFLVLLIIGFGAINAIVFFAELFIYSIPSLLKAAQSLGELPKLDSRVGHMLAGGSIDFANAIVFTLLILISFLFFKLSKSYKKVICCIILLNIIVLISTQTRTGYIAFCALLFMWGGYCIYSYKGIFIKNSKQLIKHPKKIILFLIVFILVLFLIISNKYIQQNITTRFNDTIADIKAYEADKPLTSIGMRLVMWEAASNQIPDNFWFGVGIDNLRAALTEGTQKILDKKFNLKKGLIFGHYHNNYLTSQIYGGILSLLALFFFLGYLFLYFIKKLRSNPKLITPYTGLGYLITGQFFWLTESPFFFERTFTTYWLFLVLILAILKLEEKSN